MAVIENAGVRPSEIEHLDNIQEQLKQQANGRSVYNKAVEL